MPSITIVGNYGGSNWGDELILAGVLSLIPGEWDVTVLSHHPQKTHDLHHVRSLQMPPGGLRSRVLSFLQSDRRSWKKAVSDSDIVMMGGGGLLQSTESGAIELWTQISTQLRAQLHPKKRLIWCGQGVGPLPTTLSSGTRRLLEDSPFISVRDKVSSELLLGIMPPLRLKGEILVGTDFALALGRPKRRGKRSGTLFFLRGNGDLRVHRKSLEHLLESGNLPGPVHYFPLDQVDETEGDWLGRLGIERLPEPDSLLDLLEMVGNRQLVLSERLHGSLMAVMTGTPLIQAIGHPKMEAFWRDRPLSVALMDSETTQEGFRLMIDSALREQKKWSRQTGLWLKREQEKIPHLLPDLLKLGVEKDA